jgi:poly(3-hydroxybutyrate) depolymerase
MLGAVTIAFVLAAQQAPPADKVVKETFGAGGATRAYYLLVPAKVKADEPAPLLVLLHGSGREGRSLIEPWAPLAKQHGIILAAPDSTVRQHWSMPDDGPDFLYALVEMLRVQYPVDPERIYLFGHSAGAIHALALGVLESEYFAAVSAHAGVLTDPMLAFVERAPRKIPIAIWVGTNDALFPLAGVRATRDALKARGFSAELTEIGGHTHAYYDRAMEINRQVWGFLQQHRLGAEPKYQRYETRK